MHYSMHTSVIRAALRSNFRPPFACSKRCFSTTPSLHAKNRIWPARVRNESHLHSLILSSASTRVPLLTLWMTTWSRESDEVSPILRELIEKDGIGEDKGTVSFVEVETDSPDLGGISGMAQRYGINHIPTLLAFDRQEPQIETKVSKLDHLKDKEFLIRWIETEAARHGSGGAGGRFFGLFGR
ncbi:hypothetical protein AC579_5706 [Pseudocercospora musae]|uniref:Thioredoxin domain-containing protein n=1 Tax=Pseudocercospora musae TaxID=113226 RepID=A0A139IRJ3_9PEZI|nr:hypothetical protein AC579_5706 [Pseudocercospora musae]